MSRILLLLLISQVSFATEMSTEEARKSLCADLIRKAKTYPELIYQDPQFKFDLKFYCGGQHE